MKNKLKRIAIYVYNLKFGIVVIWSGVLVFSYLIVKGIYIDFKYHFAEILSNIKFWVIFISIGLLLHWGINKNRI